MGFGDQAWVSRLIQQPLLPPEPSHQSYRRLLRIYETAGAEDVTKLTARLPSIHEALGLSSRTA